MKRAAVYIFLFLVFSFFPVVFLNAEEVKVYRIGTGLWPGWAPLNVADAKGFWRDEDLNVEVVPYKTIQLRTDALKAGHIDFAMGMVGDVIGSFMDGDPFVLIAETSCSYGGDKIIINSSQELSGKGNMVIGLYSESPALKYFLYRYLAPQNLKLSQFRLVRFNTEDLVEQFGAGRVPVVVLYDPFALRALRFGNGSVLATSADYDDVLPECMFTTSGRLGKIPEEDTRRILKGWVKAVTWISDENNAQEHMKILRERTFGNKMDFSSRELLEMIEGVKIHSPETMNAYNRTGGGLHRYLVSIRKFMSDSGELKRDFSVGDVFDNRFVSGVLDEY